MFGFLLLAYLVFLLLTNINFSACGVFVDVLSKMV